jgi:hypothetical protein
MGVVTSARNLIQASVSRHDDPGRLAGQAGPIRLDHRPAVASHAGSEESIADDEHQGESTARQRSLQSGLHRHHLFLLTGGKMADCTRGHCAAWHSRGAATARMRRDNSPQHLLGWLSNASSPEASAPIALNCFGMVAEPTHTPTLSRSATQPAKCQGSSSANRHSAGRVDQPKWLRKGPPVPPSRLHPALVLDHRITRARSRCARADRSQGAIRLGPLCPRPGGAPGGAGGADR